MPRFSKADQLELKCARVVLRDRTGTPEGKAAAEKTVARIQTERTRRIEARKSAGVEPKRKNFETEEQYETALQDYWTKLDRLAAEREARRILANPNASTLVRNRAYERLGIEPPEPQKADESISDSQEEAPKKTNLHSFTDAELEENRRREQEFYDTLAAIRLAEKEKEQHQ
jgi:hypothetical protein